MKRVQDRGRGDGRQGVALIVVLGFLSIMLLMAVAFLTQARMERMVAGSTLEAMRGRQITRTAVHAAMNDYSRFLWEENLVMPIATNGEKVFVSDSSGAQSMGGRTIGDDDIQLLLGEVEDWIPRAYMTVAVSNMVEDAEWVVVRENPNSGSSRILGRYAYVCFDMSGGMDANLAARESEVAGHDARSASNRVRRSVRQVPIRMLPEVLDAGQFKSYRSGWKGFDSLYALIKLTDGVPNDGNENSCARWQDERKECAPGAALASNLVSELTPFSLSAYRGGRYDRGSGKWTAPSLCGGALPWATLLSPIKTQFPHGELPDWINDALYDYTHDNVVPYRQDLDYPSPKNVPMFNEIAGSYRLVETEDASNPGFSTYSLRLTLGFEFWYPFPSATNRIVVDTFQLPAPTVGGSFATSGDAQLWFRLVLQGMGTEQVEMASPADQSIAPASSNLTVAASWSGGTPYVPTDPRTNFIYTIPLRRPPGNTNALPSGMTLRVQGLKVLAPVYLKGPGGNADMVPVDLSFPGANLTKDSQPKMFASAVTDPRMNHEVGQWVANEGGGNGSLNGMNEWINNAAARRRFLAEGTNLYCRNGPMETPAELGFISTGGAEWETIDLFSDDAVDMLASLVADSNLFYSATHGSHTWTVTNVFYTNGTINPNTRSSNVLTSAFIDLATHEVPNVYSNYNIAANPLNDDTVGGMDIISRIVGEILDETEEGTFSTAFQAGSDWVRIPCMDQGGALSVMDLDNSGVGFNNNQREQLLRNTWGLFSPDNSLFTVVVVGQAIKEGPSGVGIWDEDDDAITGERRAVALVWRDPFKTGSNLHHEMFIRMFRYLND